MPLASPSDRTRNSLLAALGGGVATATAPDDHAGEPTLVDPPERIGGVRLQRLLGRGGIGEVYLGRHETLDIDVAVKLLASGIAEAEALVAEARTAARIQHEHVVRLLHAGCEDGRPYLVMEHVGGGDVARLLGERRALPWREAVELARQAASGLAAAHAAGFVHRDIKPANLMLTPERRVKIADLGLARRLGAKGSVSGTPAYMPPEQWEDASRVGPAADVYALGVTLFAMLAGRPPYEGDEAALRAGHRSAPVPDLSAVVPGLPRALAQLTRRMMAKQPAERPADGAAAEHELRAVLQREPAAAEPSLSGPRARWGLPTVLALLGMLATGVLAIAAGKPSLTWQTPPRAVFVVGERLAPALASSLADGLRRAGLPVIEREEVDRLVREQDLSNQKRVDDATAIGGGRLIGGHIAVFAQAERDRVALATVLVETGERAGTAVVPVEQAADAVARLVADAAEALPARGLVAPAGGHRYALDLGARHGVRVGDRFNVFAPDSTEPRMPLCVATVVEVEASHALLSIAGTAPDRPAQAERIER